METPAPWHTLSAADAAKRLGSDTRLGLSTHEAASSLERHGPNVLTEGKKRTPIGMFFDQFKDFMILVLVAASVVSGVVGEAADTIAIVVIVIMNAVIGFVQEYRAERAMEALRELASPEAVVVRDGYALRLSSSEVVPGDLVLLEAGQVVSADVRLIEAASMKVDESALTGESVVVEKSANAVFEPDAPVGDRACMAYRGSKVTYGRGTGVVCATGMDTELGRIAHLISKDERDKTPLQKRLASFGKKLSLAVLAICAVIFVAGLIRGEPVVLMFLTAVSLAVAAIPEALPAVVTISLALGAGRMVRKNALIRRLPAVETLGSVTYICTDKTGTLTKNVMEVKAYHAAGREHAWPPENPVGAVGLLCRAMALNNDARPGEDGSIIGDPTEKALFVAARGAGFESHAIGRIFPRMAEAPFDSDRKMMSTLHADPDGGYVMFTKGAVEAVSAASTGMLTDVGTVPLDSVSVDRAGEKMASEGYRVLAFGLRRFEVLPEVFGPELESGITFLGLAGMMDPPREGAKEAVAMCAAAGIKTVMITGDHPVTAVRIARDLGIHEGAHEVMTGHALDRLSLKEFEERVERIRVYARVAPEQKLKIVQALKDRGQFVAMTGDGVNDAPALKRADIGVAMGLTGTDVAKEASDMVLLDDNFATIVNAVREGRRIYFNIRKFIKYMMASNSGEIWTLFLAPFFGLPLPLLPIHILWINLVTDGLPGLSLAVEPEEKDLMRSPPRPPDESVFAHGLGAHILWVGFLMGAVTILTQAWAYTTGDAHWQSMVFTVLCLSQMGHVLAIRSERESLFTQGLMTNKPLLFSVILTFVLQMATLYIPALNAVFKTQPLTLPELGLTLALSSVVFIAVEIEKLVRRRRLKHPAPRAANA